MGYEYTYLIADFLFLAVWLGLFIWRKNTRKEMLVMSTILGVVGFVTVFVYIQDWWRPLTITNTAIGIEDFLFGFLVGGIASVIYEDIFKKKIKIREVSKIRKTKRNLNFFFLLSFLLILFFSCFYLLKFNSFISTIIAILPPIFIIWIKRKDLIIDSIVTGALLVIIASLVYTAVEFLTPGWIQAFWYFKNVPNIVIFNLPLDDLVWYFLAGLFIGPLYEYWKEGKLIKNK